MTDLLPILSKQLREALRDHGRGDLADQVDSLSIWERCGCGDDFCSSFFTDGPRPAKGYRDEGEHQTVALIIDGGMVNVDTVSGSIRHVEVLDRSDVHAAIEGLPKAWSRASRR
jgi:hypothetical protein